MDEQRATTARRTAHVPTGLSVLQDLSLAYFSRGMPAKTSPFPESFVPGYRELTLGRFRKSIPAKVEMEMVEMARLKISSKYEEESGVQSFNK